MTGLMKHIHSLDTQSLGFHALRLTVTPFRCNLRVLCTNSSHDHRRILRVLMTRGISDERGTRQRWLMVVNVCQGDNTMEQERVARGGSVQDLTTSRNQNAGVNPLGYPCSVVVD
jgi:hypothetical protein